MRFHCRDPFDGVSRVIDIARRLDLSFDRLDYRRLDDGRFLLDVELTDAACHAAGVFFRRVALLHALEPEPADA